MTRIYQYEGFTLKVSVESNLTIGARRLTQRRPGYIAVVKIFRGARLVSPLSPLRFGETAGRPFSTEDNALMGGYSAARNLIDDVFCHEPH
jgi:hypothetical protein